MALRQQHTDKSHCNACGETEFVDDTWFHHNIKKTFSCNFMSARATTKQGVANTTQAKQQNNTTLCTSHYKYYDNKLELHCKLPQLCNSNSASQMSAT